MSTKHKILLVIAVIVAAGCVRLGFWQLSRLHERRTHNASVASAMSEPALATFPPHVERYRHIQLDGQYDYANEVTLTSRSRNGSPGVYLLTPLRRAGTD